MLPWPKKKLKHSTVIACVPHWSPKRQKKKSSKKGAFGRAEKSDVPSWILDPHWKKILILIIMIIIIMIMKMMMIMIIILICLC